MNNVKYKYIYICPFCKAHAKSGGSLFKSWNSVCVHANKCKNRISPNPFFFDKQVGPWHFSLFTGTFSYPKINKLYPTLNTTPGDIKKNFIAKGFKFPIDISWEWTSEELIEELQFFYKLHNRIPQASEFDIGKPNRTTISDKFGSWNNAIEAAGFTPNYSHYYGQPTKALDGVVYRSQAEAIFVNKYLYGKYDYVYETKYKDKLWKYDFYIPEKNLYIEIDGNLRPERMKEKLEYHKENNIRCLIVQTNELYNNKDIIID